PFAMTVMPGWFAEGVAQYQVPGLGYETWDSHRDMILRTAALDERLLSYNELGVFGKNSLGNEKVYDHGYAFVSYLAKNYGVDTFRKVSQNMKNFFRLSLDGALKKATGKKARDLYLDWTNEIRAEYSQQTRDILENKIEGRLFESKGFGNLHPAWSPDGSKIAYLTNQGNDYLSQTKLVVKDVETGKSETISAGARHSISWSPDGTQLAYANKSARSKGGSHYFDIYIYDFKKKKEIRQTKGQRAHSPNWSPDGKKLVFVSAKDGTKNLGVFDLESKKIDQLTKFKNGEQLSNPQWSPDSKSILFAKSIRNGKDLLLFELASAEIKTILEGPFDSRDAVFSKDGAKIYFSWDKTGIFNIYSKDLESGETQQLTNVLGGAFMASVNDRGELAFANFTSEGYKISLLSNPMPIDASKSKYLAYKNSGIKMASIKNSVPESLLENINIRNFDDSKVPDFEVKRYKNHYSPVSFLPRVMIDYGTVKVGSYLYSYDVLNKYGFLAGFAANSRFDYDLFALIDFRKLGPTLFIEAYNQVQNTSVKVEDPNDLALRQLSEVTDKFKFNLAEVDIGARFKLSDSNMLRTAFVFSRYGARLKLPSSTGLTTLNYTYFIGRDFSFKFSHRSLKPAVNSEISPKGRTITLGYDREFNKFLRDFATDRAVSIEVFDKYNYNKFTLDWKEFRELPIKDHTLNLDIQGGFIDTKVDSFFNFFGGGILGNRGYPYFSIEGRKMLLGRFTYRFPLFRHLGLRLMHMYFDKVFLGVFYDYGNAFNENKLKLSNFKSSVGFEIRADSFYFYSFPNRIFFNAAYGLDKFEAENQSYGKEWRYYFGLSFGYLD
ncbi:PD40 domain-containing protein, partial [candidate division KSB1 bacterium]|nr:PD40 domain-containing protein [candidate division KSB1 bacterium]